MTLLLEGCHLDPNLRRDRSLLSSETIEVSADRFRPNGLALAWTSVLSPETCARRPGDAALLVA